MVQTKLFTPREANRSLPLVKRIVRDILDTGQKVNAMARGTGKPTAEDGPMRIHLDRLDELFDELKKIGCSYRDWNYSVGLVDFPALVNGREVHLCWRSDEPDIRFYHEPETGYAGRKPIPPELLNN